MDSSKKSPWLIPVKKSSHPQMIRMFCFHHVGGSATNFGIPKWTKLFAEQLEIIAVQLPGRGQRVKDPLLSNIDDVVSNLRVEILPFLQNQPFVFLGKYFNSYITHSKGLYVEFL
jgi:surfactin synthase thioesterase subunit